MSYKSAIGILVLVGFIAAVVDAQVSRSSSEQALGVGDLSRLASPDGKRVLYLLPYQQGLNEGPQLWIEEPASQRKQLLLSLGGTLTARWSPDSKAFAVNDHLASDTQKAYIYDAATLERIDVGEKILSSDSQVRRFEYGHSYFDVESWPDPLHVLVRFYGHTDESPAECFNFQYVVARNGAATKIRGIVSPVGGSACN